MNNYFKRINRGNLIEYFILSIILIGSVLVRLYRINQPLADWHSWRQSDTASVTRIYIDHGINLLYPRYYDISSVQTGYFNPNGYRFVEFPTFNLIHIIFYRLIPGVSLESSGRLVSIFAAFVSSLILYALGKTLMGKNEGLFASFFYSFLPFNIYFTRTILPDSLAVTFALVSMYFYILYFEKKKTGFLLAASMSFSLAMLTKPFVIFYSLPIIYLAIKKYGVGGLFRNIPLLLALDVALVPFFLWRAWIGNGSNIVGIPHIKWAYNGDKIRFRPAFWRWIFGERVGRLILGIWGIIPFSFGVLFKKKNDFFLNLFLLGMFLYVSIIATANVRHDYYQIFIIPAICLVLAKGSLIVWGLKEANLFLRKAIFIFSLAMMFGVSLYETRGFFNINDRVIVDAGRRADEVLPKDALVIAPYNGNTAFLYQTRRFGWPVVNESIDGMIDKGADYYISTNLGDSDTQNFSKRFVVLEKTANFVIIDLHKEKKS